MVAVFWPHGGLGKQGQLAYTSSIMEAKEQLGQHGQSTVFDCIARKSNKPKKRGQVSHLVIIRSASSIPAGFFIACPWKQLWTHWQCRHPL